MKKILLFLSAGLILVIFVINFFLLKNNENKIKAKIGNQIFILEVADTEAKRSRGLSGRKSLGRNEGMLFIFNKKERYTFWMKDMEIPLDFIWLDDNTVADITKNVLPPNYDLDNLKLYNPMIPVNKVIEINADTIERLQLSVGENIEFLDS